MLAVRNRMLARRRRRALVCHSIARSEAPGAIWPREAGLMLDSAVAIRSYTSNEIVPLLEDRLKTRILAAKRAVLRGDAEFLEAAREVILNIPTRKRRSIRRTRATARRTGKPTSCKDSATMRHRA
jgi:hypothetical protein